MEQDTLFDTLPDWATIWKGMPTFDQKDLSPNRTIYVHFRNQKDFEEFEKLIGQKIIRYAGGPGSVWFPKIEIGRMANKRFRAIECKNPRFPVYIISKGRWESRLTQKALEKIGVPYHIVVEPQEFDQYAAVVNKSKIKVLPFSNLGQGSIPARNWVWEDSIKRGFSRHWIMDDNIDGFYRLYDNIKTPCACGNIFRAAEDLTERYENVAISGFNYFMFANRKDPRIPPLYLNTRIYSCILLKNDIPYRWRGRYNEDTDLSIRALKDGWCTILFNAFLALKQTTMSMKGGNTEELYKDDGRLQMAQSLMDQHPDIVTITEKWGRYQHQVNYKPFSRNKLKLKVGVVLPDGSDDYGMELEIDKEELHGNGTQEDAGEVMELNRDGHVDVCPEGVSERTEVEDCPGDTEQPELPW